MLLFSLASLWLLKTGAYASQNLLCVSVYTSVLLILMLVRQSVTFELPDTQVHLYILTNTVDVALSDEALLVLFTQPVRRFWKKKTKKKKQVTCDFLRH